MNSHYGNKDTPVRGKLPVKQLEALSLHVTHELTSNVPLLSDTGEHTNAQIVVMLILIILLWVLQIKPVNV